MRLYSGDLRGPCTVSACDWFTHPASFKASLHFPQDALETQHDESAITTRAITLCTPDSTAPKHPRSIDPLKATRPKSAAVSATNIGDSDDPEAQRRLLVLDVLRKSKMTRRGLAEAAKVEDFRAMNYWLRGKDVSQAAVSESGRLVYEWAMNENDRLSTHELRRSGTSSSAEDASGRKRARFANDMYDRTEALLKSPTLVALTPRFTRTSKPLASNPVTPIAFGVSPAYLGQMGTRSPVPPSLFNTPIAFRSKDASPGETPSTIECLTSSTYGSKMAFSPEPSPSRPLSFDDALFAHLGELPKETPGFKMYTPAAVAKKSTVKRNLARENVL